MIANKKLEELSKSICPFTNKNCCSGNCMFIGVDKKPAEPTYFCLVAKGFHALGILPEAIKTLSSVVDELPYNLNK